MTTQDERHVVVTYLPCLALLASLGLLIYAIPWGDLGDILEETAEAFQTLREHEMSLDDNRIVRVFVTADRADEVEVEEWMERPLERQKHPNGTVEYYGVSGVGHQPGCGTPLGNVGVWIRHERNTLHYDIIPSDRELHVHIGEGGLRQKVVATE